MVNIAIMGFGVVGSGVLEVIQKNSKGIATRAMTSVEVKKILDIRDFNNHEYASLFTKNADEIFNDKSIRIVVETIGGVKIAYALTKRAFESGKHVVTSNKELVAKFGPELMQIAKANNVHYFFEASVGGGIPIIRPLRNCLAANEISEVCGVLNGTTNYILTRMKDEKINFKEALKEAQEKGYAEADPTSDIEGYDAGRKIAILSSIAYGEFVDCENILTKGIKDISLDDMNYADKEGYEIKLIAKSKRSGEGIIARVTPCFVPKDNPLASVKDVYNAVLIQGNAIGRAMFYGQGAGKLPTASAVVADVIDAIRHECIDARTTWVRPIHSNLLDSGKEEVKLYVRAEFKDEKAIEKISLIEGVRIIDKTKKQLVFFTPLMERENIYKVLNDIKDIDILSIMTVEE